MSLILASFTTNPTKNPLREIRCICSYNSGSHKPSKLASYGSGRKVHCMSSISESFESVETNPIKDLNHVVPADFKSVEKLPDSHIWDSSDDYPILDPLVSEYVVPTIDFTDPNAMTLMQQAGEKWGVFQLINHGIPSELLDDVEFETSRLFELPMEKKLLASRSTESLTGYGLARISKFFPKLMWSEGFTIIGSPVQHATKLWPDDYTRFCTIMEKYQKEMKNLSEEIIGVMFMSLGLALEDMEWLNNDRTPRPTVLQLNSYPMCPDPSLAMGLAPHTDSSIITLLYQSNTSGLQVLLENIGWITVQPLPGALIVNVGDLMQILSNGKFKSILHRALVNNKHRRISVAYFNGPPQDVKISPLMKLTGTYHPPLYRPVTWKEYLDARETHFDKALEFIRM